MNNSIASIKVRDEGKLKMKPRSFRDLVADQEVVPAKTASVSER